jgi:hypothetical protein
LILNDSRVAIKLCEIVDVNTAISLSREFVTRGRRDGLVVLKVADFLVKTGSLAMSPLSDIAGWSHSREIPPMRRIYSQGASWS